MIKVKLRIVLKNLNLEKDENVRTSFRCGLVDALNDKLSQLKKYSKLVLQGKENYVLFREDCCNYFLSSRFHSHRLLEKKSIFTVSIRKCCNDQ